MNVRGRLALVALALSAAACGGGGGGAAGPSPVGPSAPTGSNSVTGLVFYDQNGNGTRDGGEDVRLPGVRVMVGAQSGATDAAGQFTATSLPSGSQNVTIQTDTLPPYFQAGSLAAVMLPISAGSVVPVPVTLAIGNNRPNTYLGFGDSITEGDGSAGSDGWTVGLEGRLRAYWGAADVIKDGVPGTRSDDGATRLPRSLQDERPAFVLILYGTNDWNRCGNLVPEACFTVTELRDMIRNAKAASSLPVVGTIIPANPLFTDRGAFERNRWIKAQNELIRKLAQEEGAVVADTHAAFGTDETAWASLFSDHVHPNDDGYARITEAFFQALTRGRGTR